MEQDLSKHAADTIRSLVEKTASLERERDQYKKGLERAVEKLAEYERKDKAEKLADQMIDLGMLTHEDRQDKIAELLSEDVNLEQVKIAIDNYNPNNAWGSVEQTEKQGGAPKTSEDILQDMNDWLASTAV